MAARGDFKRLVVSEMEVCRKHLVDFVALLDLIQGEGHVNAHNIEIIKKYAPLFQHTCNILNQFK